jgi:hypothetical protein
LNLNAPTIPLVSLNHEIELSECKDEILRLKDLLKDSSEKLTDLEVIIDKDIIVKKLI